MNYTENETCIHCGTLVDQDVDSFVVGRENECVECIARLFPSEWAQLCADDN